MQKHNIQFEKIPNLSSIIYLVLTLRPMLTSSCMLKCPHCALTFCDLLNERTPPPQKKKQIVSPLLAWRYSNLRLTGWLSLPVRNAENFLHFLSLPALRASKHVTGSLFDYSAADSSRCIDACLVSGGLLTERIQWLSRVHLQPHGLRPEQRRHSWREKHCVALSWPTAAVFQSKDVVKRARRVLQ